MYGIISDWLERETCLVGDVSRWVVGLALYLAAPLSGAVEVSCRARRRRLICL